MARYLHRIGDGASFGYIDEDGGPDKMLYTRDGTWLGFITDDGGSVNGPDGVPLFSIADGYFYDASGAALLYLGEAEEETEEEEAISADPEVVQYEEGMRGYLVRIAKSIGTKPIIFTPAQVEIILNAAQTLTVFGHTDFFYRVVGCLRETTDVDDTAVRHAAEQARQEFQQQQPQD